MFYSTCRTPTTSSMPCRGRVRGVIGRPGRAAPATARPPAWPARATPPERAWTSRRWCWLRG